MSNQIDKVPKCFIDQRHPGIIRFTDGADSHDWAPAGARAPMIVKAVNEYSALKAVAGAANALAALEVSECPKCSGSGLDNQTTQDACHRCAGTGEIVSDALPQDVQSLREALKQLNAISK